MPSPPPSGLSPDSRLRHELAALLAGSQAHVDAHAVLDDVPTARVHERPDGAPHSLYEIAWHLRFTLRDILDFCRDPDYVAHAWPDAYWPDADGDDYREVVQAFHTDTAALRALAQSADLTAELPWAPGYTLLREVLVAADHAAYHLGEMVALRRRLGLWPA